MAALLGLAVAGCGGDSPGSTSSPTRGEAGTDSTTATSTASAVPSFPPATNAPAATTAMVADLGFRPAADSFTFPNYGNDLAGLNNLTPADMQAVYGDVVCASTVGGCQLIPPAHAYMDELNKGMNGGHCQGMSVTSLLFYRKLANASDYGAAATPALGIEGNAALQRRIALSFIFQYFPSVKEKTVKGTPVQVLDALTAALKDKSVTYGLGFYKRDMSGGHEVTPFAVEDLGGGRFAIDIYDNNYPGTTRQVMVDRTADTWSYNGSTNPAVTASDYDGDATTRSLEIDPLEPGVGRQPCPFCGAPVGQAAARGNPAGPATTATATATEEIFLEGNPVSHAHLLITDDAGHRLGYDQGVFISEIPGADAAFPREDTTWKENLEPVYTVPAGGRLTIAVDGAGLAASDIETMTVVGPDSDIVLDNLTMARGQKDTVVLSADRQTLQYTPGASSSPVIVTGAMDPSVDYSFALSTHGLAAGATLGVALAPDKLTLDGSRLQADSSYDIEMLREDASGEGTFKHRGLLLPAGRTASLAYPAWHRRGDPITATVSGAEQSLADQG